MRVRWDYAVGVPQHEALRRRELEQRVEAWWAAFGERTGALDDLFSGRSKWDLPGWMAETLQAIDPNLMWEFGPAVETKGHRLVITPESRRELMPLVRHLVGAAPTVDGWEVYDHRLAEPLEMARRTVEGRCGRASELTEVTVTLGEQNCVELRYRGPSVERDDDAALDEAYILSEALLGEDLLYRWVGSITVHPRPKRGFPRLAGREEAEATPVPLEELKAQVDEMIATVHAGLSDMASVPENATWSLLELEPEQRDDYPGQTDLLVAKTPNLDLWRSTRTDIFHDGRFSSSGQTFCYVKLDGSEGLDEEGFSDKAEIEDALDALLMPSGWGCQIGGGTGLRYSYIELVLRDCDSALPAIRQLLAEGKVPKRSWILFHDCEHASEWVGIYDDSPPPPST